MGRLLGKAVRSRTPLTISARNLQKGFQKHGGDFGLSGNWNASRGEEFAQAVQQHVASPTTRVIEGTYRGMAVRHYVEPRTGLNVMSDPAGNFVGGWRLGAEQLKSVLDSGRLFLRGLISCSMNL